MKCFCGPYIKFTAYELYLQLHFNSTWHIFALHIFWIGFYVLSCKWSTFDDFIFSSYLLIYYISRRKIHRCYKIEPSAKTMSDKKKVYFIRIILQKHTYKLHIEQKILGQSSFLSYWYFKYSFEKKYFSLIKLYELNLRIK